MNMALSMFTEKEMCLHIFPETIFFMPQNTVFNFLFLKKPQIYYKAFEKLVTEPEKTLFFFFTQFQSNRQVWLCKSLTAGSLSIDLRWTLFCKAFGKLIQLHCGAQK